MLENSFGLRHLDAGDFIDRVEYRSSLLMMTGKDLEEGQLQDFYEFRHLTFQEYLCAQACVEGWHAGRNDGDCLASVLQPHLKDEKWKEVIPLAAVLGGKQTAGLLSQMMEPLKQVDPLEKKDTEENPMLILLIQCLADEAPASPSLIEQAAECLLANAWGLMSISCIGQFWSGRHGQPVRDLVAARLESPKWAVPAVFVLESQFGILFLTRRFGQTEDEVFKLVIGMLDGSVPQKQGYTPLHFRVEAGLLAMNNAWALQNGRTQPLQPCASDLMVECHDRLCEWLWSEQFVEQHVAVSAFVWFFANDCLPTRLHVWAEAGGVEPLPPNSDVLGRLIQLDQNATNQWTRDFTGWALSQFPVVSEGRGHFGTTLEKEEIVEPQSLSSDLSGTEREMKTLIIAWYRRQPWTDAELVNRLWALPIEFHNETQKRRRDQLLALLEAEGKAKNA